MFGQVNGLPTHALALHAAVVLVPLSALLGLLFALPRSRAWSRVPLVVVSVAAVVAVFVARQSGEQLQRVLQLQGPAADLVHEHAQRSDVLQVASLGYAVLAVIAFAITRSSAPSRGLLTAISVLVVLGAAGVAFQTYRVGDVGARAVWNPTGQVDYGSADSGD